MGYYGDRRGDYYRGDPGFLGNLFRGIGHIATGAIGGFLTGGPKGAVTGAIGGAVSGTRRNIAATTLEAGGSESAYTPALRKAHAAALARGPVPSGAMAITGGSKMRALRGGGGGGFGRRRMNWANSKALGRAERRIYSAVKHMSKYIRWVHPGRVGHAAPKFKRRRK